MFYSWFEMILDDGVKIKNTTLESNCVSIVYTT